MNNKRREKKLIEIAETIAALERNWTNAKDKSPLEEEMEKLILSNYLTLEEILWVDDYIEKNKLI